MEKKDSHEDHRLGLTSEITRRDFLNNTLLGSGAALLSAGCPAHALAEGRGAAPPAGAVAHDLFTGYGGVGDYAEANGNTQAVMQAAHKVRDGVYAQFPHPPEETGEMFDLIVVGGGLAGLMAALEYEKQTQASRRCLILENHAVFGGEARQNEFEVDGYRLVGPQGSNDAGVPAAGSKSLMDTFFTDCNLPRQYTFQEWDPTLKPMRFARDNYANMDGFSEGYVDVAYYFDQKSGAAKPGWMLNIWGNDFAGTPFSERAKADLRRWRDNSNHTGDEDPHVLDTMTYQHYLEVVKGYDPAVTKFSQPMVGLLGGVGSDAVSARVAHTLVISHHNAPRAAGMATGWSFPGGNSTMGRHLVRRLIPDSISGDFTLEGVMDGKINFAAIDRAGQPTRIRLRSTVVRVEHEAQGAKEVVAVTYENGGRIYRSRAGAVIMASGGWITKRVVAGLPDDIRAAYDKFCYAPALIANVALNNWRFMYKLGAPAARWMDDGTMFGYVANIRQNMIIGDYNPPLHPDKPTILTFYMGIYFPGQGYSVYEQGVRGRMKLLSTSYADYERTIRRQMTEMFSSVGFDAKRDIAGIILNRWGHARLSQPPGFYYGVDGKPSPREVVANGFGRIAIGHSELNGEQHASSAFFYGIRAAHQVLDMDKKQS